MTHQQKEVLRAAGGLFLLIVWGGAMYLLLVGLFLL